MFRPCFVCWGSYKKPNRQKPYHRAFILMWWRESINKQVNMSMVVGEKWFREKWWGMRGWLGRGSVFFMIGPLMIQAKTTRKLGLSVVLTLLRALSTTPGYSLALGLLLLCPMIRTDSTSLVLIICWQTKHFNRKFSLLSMIQEGSTRRNFLYKWWVALGFIEHLMGIQGMHPFPKT